MTRLSFGLVSLCLIWSCNGGGPGPQPTPEPTATPWECPLAVPGCHETDPPQTCSSEAFPCWHNPTQDPEHCEFAPDCSDSPLPQPQCATFTDRGGNLRTLAGDPCGCWEGEIWAGDCEGGCVIESNLVAIDCPVPGAKFQGEVKIATDTLGDLRGRPPQENLSKLADQLVVQMPNRCTIGGIEAVFIQRDDGSYEENHAVFFGNGAWTNSGRGAFIGCHEDTGNPTEPPSGQCVDPDPTGLEAEFNLKPHGQLWDSTYRVRNRAYCDAVCSPTEPDVCFAGRNACPLRMEGDPEREVCERQEIGDQQWWCNGSPIDPEDHNSAQARCHGHVKTCTENGRTCAEADW